MSFSGALDSVRADDGPRFLIKGGASMELRLGLGARTTKDVDIVFRGAPNEMLGALERRSLSHTAASPFAARGPRNGQPSPLRAGWLRRQGLGRPCRSRWRGPRQTNWNSSLWQSGSPTSSSTALRRSRVSHCATRSPKKIHAVTEQPGSSTNHRYWDLIDLQLQRELLGNDLARVREACFETFTGRGLHSWPPELVVPEDWHEPYAKVAADSKPNFPWMWVPPPTRSGTSSRPSIQPSRSDLCRDLFRCKTQRSGPYTASRSLARCER